MCENETKNPAIDFAGFQTVDKGTSAIPSVCTFLGRPEIYLFDKLNPAKSIAGFGLSKK